MGLPASARHGWLAQYLQQLLENTMHWSYVVSMLGQRQRRWANVKTTLFQCIVFAGNTWHRLNGGFNAANIGDGDTSSSQGFIRICQQLHSGNTRWKVAAERNHLALDSPAGIAFSSGDNVTYHCTVESTVNSAVRDVSLRKLYRCSSHRIPS